MKKVFSSINRNFTFFLTFNIPVTLLRNIVLESRPSQLYQRTTSCNLSPSHGKNNQGRRKSGMFSLLIRFIFCHPHSRVDYNDAQELHPLESDFDVLLLHTRQTFFLKKFQFFNRYQFLYHPFFS